MIQDMLRVFIIRIACQKVENASVLLRPIFSWICESTTNISSPSEVDAYKVKMLVQSPIFSFAPDHIFQSVFLSWIIHLQFLSHPPLPELQIS